MKNTIQNCLAICEICLMFFLWSHVCHAKILYHADYEEGDILDGHNYGISAERCCGHSINVVGTVARLGKKSCRFASYREDPKVFHTPGRAELKVQLTKPIVEEWYAWSIYLPKEMKPDIAEVLGQWHSYPDKKEGESWRTVPLTIYLEQDNWKVKGYYTEKRVSTSKDLIPAFPEIKIPARKGVWTDWIFHIKWDYRTKENQGTGFVETWQQVDGNGYNKIIDYKGPIGYNDKIGVYLKFGLYKYTWKKAHGNQSPRYFYYDEVKIGDAESCFDDMEIHD